MPAAAAGLKVGGRRGVAASFAEEMSVRTYCVLSLLVALFPLYAADSATAVKQNTPSLATSVHQEGASPEDAIWAKNVSTLVDNCNWWNNYGNIVVGSPSAVAEKLTFESVCATSLWGALDIDVFNKGARVAYVRAQFSFGHYMLIYDGNGNVLANFRESWGTMMFRSFYSVFYLYEGESDVLIGRAERSTFLNSELKWFAAVKGQDCDDSDAHNNCITLAVDEYKMTWQFLACAGYPWNFAWVNMPPNPVHRMAIQIASIEKDYMLHHHKGSSCHGFYWLGIFLLVLIGVAGLFFLCDRAQRILPPSRSSGEERPLLA